MPGALISYLSFLCTQQWTRLRNHGLALGVVTFQEVKSSIPQTWTRSLHVRRAFWGTCDHSSHICMRSLRVGPSTVLNVWRPEGRIHVRPNWHISLSHTRRQCPLRDLGRRERVGEDKRTAKLERTEWDSKRASGSKVGAAEKCKRVVWKAKKMPW